MPVRNGEPYLTEAIDSVLAQHASLELLVVDDGSTDGSLDTLAKYGSRLTLLRRSGAGAYRTRNAAARIATGRWLAFIDADDTWLPGKLEAQLAAAGDRPLVYTDRLNIGNRGDLPAIHSELVPVRSGDVFVDLLLTGNFITTSSVLLRRDIFEELDGFVEHIPRAADWDLWLRVAERYPVEAIHEPLVGYRFHDTNISHDLDLVMCARRMVIDRALSSPRGRTLGRATQRRIRGHTWMTNAGDLARHQQRRRSLAACAQAARHWPFVSAPFKHALKLGLGRV
jgi:glycosyltransferase involved in cell wall biosynthesis